MSAQSGPSAIAFAPVRELIAELRTHQDVFPAATNWSIEFETRLDIALSDATTPPAGARDASDFEYRTLSLPGANGDRAWLPWQQFGTHMQIRERNLTGKADGSQEIMPPSREPKTERDVRQALADLHREYRERCKPFVDILAKIEANKPPTMAWMPKATQPAATGDGEGQQ